MIGYMRRGCYIAMSKKKKKSSTSKTPLYSRGEIKK